ncbi:MULTISPECIES: hypothetical protein [Rhodococcus]|uniref:hypothetical protein n=1 Tax=Rhodococcus TaxID=1827 RepID=UPI000815D2C4|nr:MULTISPECIES: hypothetical protein [Rhodococcus]SCC64097.1 hypothetical protein GA0061093_11755 [Rhodococcus qingshengii]
MNANLALLLAVIGAGPASPTALRAMPARAQTDRVALPAHTADVTAAVQPG